MTAATTVVREQQRAWARERGICFDSAGYTFDLDDNLFQPLSPATEVDVRCGDGSELGPPGKRGKMQALHSSSALACNVFDFWRKRDATPLAEALGLARPIEISFEQKFPTGLPGHAPNLDLVLRPSTGPVLAVESKFLEPYGAHERGFKRKYDGVWEQRGYWGCQSLASRLNSGDKVFRWLYAEQLLKHILGLACWGAPWRLMYLWYEVPGLESGEHAAEATEFAGVMRADGIGFESLSYQSLFANLRKHAGNDGQDYVDYVSSRYFPASHAQVDQADAASRLQLIPHTLARAERGAGGTWLTRSPRGSDGMRGRLCPQISRTLVFTRSPSPMPTSQGSRSRGSKRSFYVGMTNSAVGLRARLRQFDRTISGGEGHGGGCRVRYVHHDHDRLIRRLFVSVHSFECDVNSRAPQDLRTMGDVAREEYECFARYVTAHGSLPEFNRPESPKLYGEGPGRQAHRAEPGKLDCGAKARARPR